MILKKNWFETPWARSLVVGEGGEGVYLYLRFHSWLEDKGDLEKGVEIEFSTLKKEFGKKIEKLRKSLLILHSIKFIEIGWGEKVTYKVTDYENSNTTPMVPVAKKTRLKAVAKSDAKVEKLGDLCRDVIKCYCEAFKARYGTGPMVGGKEVGIIRTLVKDFGIEKSITLVQTYLRMSDRYFLQKSHDLATLKFNINSIMLFAKKNTRVTPEQARHEDILQSNDALIEEAKKQWTQNSTIP